MHRELATAGPLVLAHSRALAVAESWWTLLPGHVPYPLAERQQVGCPNRELAHSCALACVADTRALPPESLRPRNCGCNPPARPDEPPPRECRVPVSPHRTFGEPGLVGVGSQSRVPSAGL